MFSNSSVCVRVKSSAGSKKIMYRKVEVNRDAKNTLINMVNRSANYILQLDRVEFTPDYQVSSGECYVIRDYELPSSIYEAIRDVQFLDEYDPKKSFISLVVVGDCNHEIFGFQRIAGNSFSKKKCFVFKDNVLVNGSLGLFLNESLDALYYGGDLYFCNFERVNSFLDNLSSYYRVATKEELESFMNSESLLIEDPESFEQSKSVRFLRKIYLIQDRRVLESHTVDEIVKVAFDRGIKLDVSDGKIIVPKDKSRLNDFFDFLVGNVFVDWHNDVAMVANSVKKLQ